MEALMRERIVVLDGAMGTMIQGYKLSEAELIALAEAGHGIAVVPSTVRFMSRKIRIMPIVQDGKSLGTWSAVVWDLSVTTRPRSPRTARASMPETW